MALPILPTVIATTLQHYEDISGGYQQLVEDINAVVTTTNAILTAYAYSTRKTHEKKARILNFVENTVPRYTDTQFKEHFRMDRGTFEELCKWVSPHLPKQRTVCVERKMLATLWLLGTTESYRSVADRFNLNKGSLHEVVSLLCKTLTSLRDEVIVWPNIALLANEAEQFAQRCGFPGVVGAIDGTHIRIPGPSDHRDSYICRKGFPAMHLQVVCNKDLLIIDVFTGWPGSVHDSRVFKNSPIYERLSHGLLPSQYHLLADSAYQLAPFLIVPFRDNGHLTPMQTKFNLAHSRTRVEVEMCFGLLKSKFRRMRFLEATQLLDIPSMIVAACVLHNFTRRRCLDEEVEFELDSQPEDVASGNEEEGDRDGAAEKRVQLALLLQ